MITENEILVQYDDDFKCSRIYHKCNSKGFNFSYLNFWYKTKKKSRNLVCPKCKFIIQKTFLDFLRFIDVITLRADYGYCFRPGVFHSTCGFAAFSDEFILKDSMKIKIEDLIK